MFVFKHLLVGPVDAGKVQPGLLCACFSSVKEEWDKVGSWGHPQLSEQAARPIPGER